MGTWNYLETDALFVDIYLESDNIQFYYTVVATIRALFAIPKRGLRDGVQVCRLSSGLGGGLFNWVPWAAQSVLIGFAYYDRVAESCII